MVRSQLARLQREAHVVLFFQWETRRGKSGDGVPKTSGSAAMLYEQPGDRVLLSLRKTGIGEQVTDWRSVAACLQQQASLQYPQVIGYLVQLRARELWDDRLVRRRFQRRAQQRDLVFQELFENGGKSLAEETVIRWLGNPAFLRVAARALRKLSQNCRVDARLAAQKQNVVCRQVFLRDAT